MTIAACYLSPEGIVFGADSASTYQVPGNNPFLPPRERHYNFGQKLFEIGKGSTLAAVTWGLGGLAIGSYRTLLARLADDIEARPISSVEEAAFRWATQFWQAYTTSLQPEIDMLKAIAVKRPFDRLNPQSSDPDVRTVQEEMFLQQQKEGLIVGFCLGGCIDHDRVPHAYELIFDPLADVAPTPQHLPQAQTFWGVPALISRLINGCASGVIQDILSSGKWAGSEEDLLTLVGRHKLVHPPTVPIREAIDFTHACLLTTIKAMKFSNLPLLCGGPIELAVITTDREFRWVKHKSWQSAINDGEDHGFW